RRWANPDRTAARRVVVNKLAETNQRTCIAFQADRAATVQRRIVLQPGQCCGAGTGPGMLAERAAFDPQQSVLQMDAAASKIGHVAENAAVGKLSARLVGARLDDQGAVVA